MSIFYFFNIFKHFLKEINEITVYVKSFFNNSNFKIYERFSQITDKVNKNILY